VEHHTKKSAFAIARLDLEGGRGRCANGVVQAYWPSVPNGTVIYKNKNDNGKCYDVKIEGIKLVTKLFVSSF